MPVPTLSPTSQASLVTLPATGTHSEVVSKLVFHIYETEAFISGAVDQVSYTYKKLGGDVLDVELTTGNVYSAYEESVLEYSYLVNMHQAKNVLSDVIGSKTASFNQDGQFTSGDSLSGSNPSLMFPEVKFEYSRKVGKGVGSVAGVGGEDTVYSASFQPSSGRQDYDLQQIISSSANDSGLMYSNLVSNKRVVIRNVFYKTPRSQWRFYGYYGGINVVGNFSTYGQFADDSTFQVIPVWQNIAQNQAFKEAIQVRNSNYSYEIRNNILRIFPNPAENGPEKYWVHFTIPTSPWEEDSDKSDTGLLGVNNMNTLPFQNIPYENINSIGKQWIRRFALALAKEMLGQIRGKFGTLPIPGSTVTLNASDLLGQAKDEQSALREELKTILDELTYNKLATAEGEKMEMVGKVFQNVPNPIFVG